MIYIDFETKSEADLKEVGAWIYSQHPTTDIICMCWAKDDGDINLWLPGDPVPECFSDPEAEFEAHNASFEIAIWRHVAMRLYNFPKLKLVQWFCSMAICAYRGLPLKLEKAAEALGLAEGKDMDGHKAMLQLTKPRKPTKTNPDRWYTKEKYPEKYDKCYKYCGQDINVERLIAKGLGPLPKGERYIWLLDRMINHRGVPVDIVGVKHALEIVDLYETTALEEFRKLTNGFLSTPSQLDKFKAWLDTKGVLTDDLTAPTVESLLSRTNIDPDARRALEIRQYLSMSSTKKLHTMLSMTGEDGTVKNTLQYHGASTGRVAGRGIQITNFPRGNIKDGHEIAQEIHDLSPKEFLAKHPDPMEHISSSLRGMISAPEGYKLYAGDFSAIEARIVMWYAGEQNALDMFESGADIYIDMAEYIYNKTGMTKKDNAKERHVGKGIVLGCFAADTKVLCNTGWKCIIDVLDTDLVWDGKEWVAHQGVIYQGVKDTLRYKGVAATQDHGVLVGNSWRGWREVHTTPSLLKSALSSASIPSLNGGTTPLEQAKLPTSLYANVPAAGRGLFQDPLLKGGSLLDATPVLRKNLYAQDTRPYGIKNCYRIENTGTGFCAGYLLASVDAITRKTHTIKAMAAEAYECLKSGLKIDQNFLNTSYHSTDGISPSTNLTGLITARDTNLGILDFVAEKLTSVIDVLYKKCKKNSTPLEKKLPVYDIYLAGPQNRFTILTTDGPLIVHNCGFGMAHEKFLKTRTTEGVLLSELLSEDMAKKAIKAYREKYSGIPAFWANCMTAAMEVTSTGREVIMDERGLTWYMDGIFLCVRLPNGRSLSFPYPKVEKVMTPWGQEKWGFTSMTTDTTKKFVRRASHGGLLVENIVQGTARDAMFDSVKRLEKADYPKIFSVYDEVVCMTKEDFGTDKEFEQLLSERPKWALDLPIATEVWSGRRYRK